MALSPVVIVTFKDRKGKTATTEVKIPTGLSLADMVEFAQQMAVLIDAITTGQIISVGIGIRIDTSGLGLTAAAGTTADVEEKGKFQFLTDGGFYTTVNIPCWSDINTVDFSDVIDTADTDVAAFIAAMISGLTMTSTNVVAPTDAREDDIVGISFARERFRGSGKRA